MNGFREVPKPKSKEDGEPAAKKAKKEETEMVTVKKVSHSSDILSVV